MIRSCKHLLSLGVVALAAACQSDAPYAPSIEPQYARGGATSAGLAGAFQTTSPQPVKIVAETRHKLELSADQSVFSSAIDAAHTLAAGAAGCATDPADASADRKAALLLKLQDALQNRHFNAYIDKTKLGAASASHRVAHTWNEPDGGLFTLRIGSADLLPGVHATATQTARDEYLFSGGALMIADRSGQVSDHLYMACPNLDTVTLTVIR